MTIETKWKSAYSTTIRNSFLRNVLYNMQLTHQKYHQRKLRDLRFGFVKSIFEIEMAKYTIDRPLYSYNKYCVMLGTFAALAVHFQDTKIHTIIDKLIYPGCFLF